MKGTVGIGWFLRKISIQIIIYIMFTLLVLIVTTVAINSGLTNIALKKVWPTVLLHIIVGFVGGLLGSVFIREHRTIMTLLSAAVWYLIILFTSVIFFDSIPVNFLLYFLSGIGGNALSLIPQLVRIGSVGKKFKIRYR